MRSRSDLARSILLTSLLVVVGATAGWFLAPAPLYESTGLVYVSPALPSGGPPDRQVVLTSFENYVSAHAAILESDRMVEMAMASPEWPDCGTREEVRARIRITRGRGTQHFLITFANERSDAARAGVRALIQAYRDLAKLELVSEFPPGPPDMAQWVAWRQKADAIDEKLREMARDYGGPAGLVS